MRDDNISEELKAFKEAQHVHSDRNMGTFLSWDHFEKAKSLEKALDMINERRLQNDLTSSKRQLHGKP